MKTHSVLLSALSLLAFSCNEQSSFTGKPEIRSAPISVLEVSASNGYFVEERFVGEVEARRESKLAFELSGTVDSVRFEEGESVAAGDVVASIDIQRLQSRKVELEASLEQARATLELARSTAERDERLADSNAISELQVEQSRANLATAEADVARHQAQIESIQVDISKSRLVAPFDGVVSRRHVDEGTVVSPGGSVLELVETSALEIRVALARDAVADLVAGDELLVATSEGTVSNFKVARILPRRDTLTRSVDVILEVPSDLPNLLRDGDLVSVLSGREIDEKGYFLPRDALTESSRGLWACFVAEPTEGASTEDGVLKLDRRDLEILHEYADVVYVRGGIDDGEWVMSAGLQKVAPGQSVTVSNVKRANLAPTLLGYRN